MLKPATYPPPSSLDQLIFDATVPADHYLRRVLQAVDFQRCRPLMAPVYDPDHGRPACEPVLLLKLEFLQYHYILSDRLVIDQAHYNMAFRLFLGLSLHSELPDPSLLCYFRRRLGSAVHQQVFDAVLGQAREKGLVKDRLRLKDATHVVANIAIPCTIVLVAQTRQRLLHALRFWSPERVQREDQQAETIRTTTADLSNEERLLQRVAHLRAIVAWADDVARSDRWEAAAAAQRQPLEQALALAHKVLADRADPDGPDHLQSLQDTEARSGKHGDYYTGYLLDVAMDADSQLVTALNVLPGPGAEPLDTVTLLQQEERAHGNDVQAVSMDGAGFHGPMLRALTEPGGLQVAVYVPPKKLPATEFYTAEQFTLSPTKETLTCPNGQTTPRRRRSYRDGGWSFRFHREVCAVCPLQSQCVARLPQTTGRVVIKNDHEAEYEAVRQRATTAAYAAVRREHRAIERKLGEFVRWHRGRRARYWGQAKVLLQGLLTGLAINVKRVVSLLGRAEAESPAGLDFLGRG
jgi:transposase